MGRSLWLHLILIFFLVPVFDLVRDFDIVQPYRYGVGFYQTSPEAPPCACTSAVAPPQDWNLLVGPHSTATSFSGLVRPSFERLWSPSCHCQSHAIAERTLAVPLLQTIAQAQCRALPKVPAPVADGDGSLLCPRNQAAASDGSSATATMELSWRASVLPGREFTSQCEVPKKVSKSKEEIPKGRQRQGQLRIWPSCAVPVLPAFATSGLFCWTTITSTEWAPAALGSTWSSNHDAYDEHDANAVPSSSAYKQLWADLCSSGYADSGGAYDDAGEGAERVVDLFAEAFCGSPSGRATEGPDGVSQAWQESYQGLQAAAKSLGEARTAYEESLLARSQHISSWKSFLAEAVKNWTDYAKMFEQNEHALQARISAAREQFQEAKECLDASKTSAGQVTEISDDEKLPDESETSAMQITESIQTLSSSLLRLSKDAESIQVEGPASKRPRTEEGAVGEDSKPPFS